jgi:uncharacterized membrane protein YedE/YeeE
MNNRGDILLAFVCGLVFGIGLVLSGMTEPSKVQGFLDITGQWDPSLGLVMGGAIAVALPFFQWAKHVRSRKAHSVNGSEKIDTDAVPMPTTIDKSLIIGSLIFGIGWGLAGFCPGPALVSASSGKPVAIIFVASMAAGMWIASFSAKKLSHQN